MKPLRLILILAALLVTMPALALPARAATAERTVTATARCVEDSASGPAHVVVAITNDSGLPIRISYVHGWTTGQAFNPTFLMRDPGEITTYSIDPGNSLVVRAPWDDLRTTNGEVGMAIVVTSMGVLAPICDGRAAGLERPLGPKPTNGTEAVNELATVAAETIGWLEMWRAYPALYALLHPDARAEASFRQVACWYANMYGIPTGWKDGVFSTKVLDLSFGAWTWSVNAKEYPYTASVTTEQEIGTLASSAPIINTTHLVSDQGDGQFRWFFDPGTVDNISQTGRCDLGV